MLQGSSRNLDGLFNVSAFEDVESRDLKCLLDDRPIIDGQLALPDAHRLGCGVRGEYVSFEAHTPAVHLVTPGGNGGRDLARCCGSSCTFGSR